jgi:hypothetical protein
MLDQRLGAAQRHSQGHHLRNTTTKKGGQLPGKREHSVATCSQNSTGTHTKQGPRGRDFIAVCTEKQDESGRQSWMTRRAAGTEGGKQGGGEPAEVALGESVRMWGWGGVGCRYGYSSQSGHGSP